MKEPVFIKQNQDRWDQVEFLTSVADSASKDPTEIKEQYILVTEDLSYARSHFPRSAIVEYLNSLALRLHRLLQPTRNKHWESNAKFWLQDIPEATYRSRGAMLLSFLIFYGSVVFGFLACEVDPEFADNTVGSSYLRTTMQNIQSGEPAAIYGFMEESSMAIGITFNNILVAVKAVSGVATLGYLTVQALFYNGIMLGALENFLWHNHVFVSFNMALLLHGVLELTAIAVAGAASFRMVQGILFPGTYKRSRSFAFAARDGLKLILSTIPLFVVAGCIEGFVTRLSDVSYVFNVVVIGASTVFVCWYYVVLPRRIGLQQHITFGASH